MKVYALICEASCGLSWADTVRLGLSPGPGPMRLRGRPTLRCSRKKPATYVLDYEDGNLVLPLAGRYAEVYAENSDEPVLVTSDGDVLVNRLGWEE